MALRMVHNLSGGYVNEKTFWRNVRKGQSGSGCWLWTSKCRAENKNGKPYGLAYVRVESVRGPASRLEGAHRISYELTHGPIPSGRYILHVCDNTLCVRPEHLRTGSAQDNADDMVVKGRQRKGPQIHTNRLTVERVVELRRLHAEGWSFVKLGLQFGVTRQQARNIALRFQWCHVP